MRTLFVLLTGLMLTQSAWSKAEEQDFDFAGDTAEFADTFAAANAQGWNRWTCIAKRPFILKMYRGSSYYFRAGSGEGQEAKLVAQKIALRFCEFSLNAPCTSNLAECTVEKY